MTDCIHKPSPEEIKEEESKRTRREVNTRPKDEYSGPPITWLDFQAGALPSEPHSCD